MVDAVPISSLRNVKLGHKKSQIIEKKKHQINNKTFIFFILKLTKQNIVVIQYNYILIL